MHVAINAHLLAHTQSFRRAGISHYVEQTLLQLGAIDRESRYDVYTTRGLSANALGLPPNFHVIPSRLPTINPRVRIPWEQFLAPLILRRTRADLFHGVHSVVPLATSTPSVVTVHDLAFIRFAQTFRAYNRAYLDFATRLSVRRAARVLVVSEHTKREVMGLLGVPAEQIVVTPNAVRDHFRVPEKSTLEAFRTAKGLPERFLLYVGTLEPRKNLPTLLEAYATIARTHDVPLIVGGGKGWLYDAVFRRLEELGLQERVRFVGYVEEEELPLWYAAATVFVFPSIYEGFGMPPLEAMACGTPVVTSNSSSLPEVVGDAGITVPPHDPAGFAKALDRVLSDAELHEELRARGLAQARRFSWRITAERTLAAYRAVAGR